MNNSEHDPANPHSDNEDADRGIHDSAADGGHDPAADAGNHGPGDGDGRREAGDDGPSDGAGSDPDNTGTHDSAASLSEDEVWRDLVARLESTDSMPDGLEDTKPSNRPGESHRPGDSPPQDGPPRQDGPPPRDQPPSSGDSPRAQPPGTQDRGTHVPGPWSTANRGRPVPRRNGQDHLGGPRDYTPEEEDDGYVPEDPPSLAGAEPLVVLAWIGAVGGPLALLLSAFFFRSIPMLAVIGIVVVFVASVVFLLMRLPSERGDDHDDGAIV